LSLVQGFEVLAILAFAVAIAAGVGLYLVFAGYSSTTATQHVVMARGATSTSWDMSPPWTKNWPTCVWPSRTRAGGAATTTSASTGTLAPHRRGAFDAYRTLAAGRAPLWPFLNSLGNGVVITTVVSRRFCPHVREVAQGRASRNPLAPEEAEAVDQGSGRGGPSPIRSEVEGSDKKAARIPRSTPTLLLSSPPGLPGRRAPFRPRGSPREPAPASAKACRWCTTK